MSCDSALQTALRPLGLPVFPNKYSGGEDEYIVTNHTSTQPLSIKPFAPLFSRLIQRRHLHPSH